MMPRVGLYLFRTALLLLPSRFRARLGPSLQSVFESGQQEVHDAGNPFSLVLFWCREVWGMHRLAVGLRIRGRWSMDLGALDTPLSIHARLEEDRRLRVGSVIEELVQDVRFGVRSALRRPAPYVLALVTFGLGMGASAGIFSVVDTVMLRPLPYPDADRLVFVYPTIPAWRGHPALDASWDRASFSSPEFMEWRARQSSFVQSAAIRPARGVIRSGDVPERIAMAQTTADLFPMLGAAPVLGRAFAEHDHHPDAAPIALLTHDFWVSWFGAARDVLGQQLRIDGSEHMIVGVLPDGFRVPGYEALVWTPITLHADESQRENHSLRVVARLADGVQLDRAEAETESILHGLSEKHPETTRQVESTIQRSRLVHGGNVVPMLRDVTRHVRVPLLILLGASALLLAVACTNVSTLVLGIGIDREQELAVRGAIGAGRRRLIRQLLTENCALALAGGIVGVSLAEAFTMFFVRLAPAGLPRLDAVQVDGRVLLATFTASAAVGIGFGLVPALSLTRTQPSERLRKVRLAGVRSRLHGGLVLLQLAMATLLLVGAGLLTRTLLELDAVDPGFRAQGLVAVSIAPNHRQFLVNDEFDGRRYDQYFDQFTVALAAIPGVEEVGISSNVPFSGSRANNEIEVEGYSPAPGEVVLGERYFVSANYMDVLGMRLLEGRGFTEADDRPDAPKVTIVSETFARRYFAGRNPIGRRVKFWSHDHEVIGVVADTRDRSLAGDEETRYYMPRRQLGGQDGAFVLRIAGGQPLEHADEIRRGVAAVDPDVPVVSVTPLAEAIRNSLAEHRFRARLMLSFAALAGVFAVLGIYAVTSRSVASRTRELGIRMALGAGRTGVMGMVVGEGIRLAASGVAVGLTAAVVATRVLASFLYGVSPSDPVTLLAVGLLLVSFAALASLAPSRRAATVDPLVALRAE